MISFKCGIPAPPPQKKPPKQMNKQIKSSIRPTNTENRLLVALREEGLAKWVKGCGKYGLLDME